MATATLDWSQCPAVESIPGKVLQDMSVDELVAEFGVTREQVQAVLQFAAHSAEVEVLHP